MHTKKTLSKMKIKETFGKNEFILWKKLNFSSISDGYEHEASFEIIQDIPSTIS